MSVPDPRMSAPPADASNSKLLRAAMWVAIGALIAGAIVCVVWVLVGEGNGLIGRAFLTILLLAGFAGVAILDAHLADRRPAWFTLTSMVVWVAVLLIGAFLIWMPEGRFSDDFGRGFTRFLSFLLIVLILQGALLHIRLFTRALARNRTPFTTIIGYVTMGLVALLAVMLVFPLMLHEWVEFRVIYWRLVVAVTILAAVGTALVPLINALFNPKRRGAAPGAVQAWPTFVDAVTPLPVMPDGSPDWNAYYTGYPSPGATMPQAPQQPQQQHYAAVPAAPQQAPQQQAPQQQQPAPLQQQLPPPYQGQQQPVPPYQPPAQQPAQQLPPSPPSGDMPPSQPGAQGYPLPPPLPPR